MAWIGFQTYTNIAVATGLFPNTGITLPFFSRGVVPCCPYTWFRNSLKMLLYKGRRRRVEMKVGLIAHDSKKKLMQNFCIAYRGILTRHELYATRNYRHFGRGSYQSENP